MYKQLLSNLETVGNILTVFFSFYLLPPLAQTFRADMPHPVVSLQTERRHMGFLPL